MTLTPDVQCTAFQGAHRIASGDLNEVTSVAKAVLSRGENAPVVIFDNVTSEVIDLDFRSTPSLGEDKTTPRGPGRPKLGVVAREITLLPRHWEWLNTQPGGASVALRKLVEEARRVNKTKDRIRDAQASTYRFMSAMAGNEPGFEEASRALFSGNKQAFHSLTDAWPRDVRDHVHQLARSAFEETGTRSATAEDSRES